MKSKRSLPEAAAWLRAWAGLTVLKYATLAACALGFAVLVVFTGSSCKSKPAQSQGSAAPAAAQPVKVLLRKRTTGNLAIDGFLWQLSLASAIDQATPEVKDLIVLDSGPDLAVETEWIEETKIPLKEKDKKKKEPSTWKLDPKNFEFLVDWTLDQQEQTKFFFGDSLKITAKEIWKIERTTNPSVSRNWNCSYLMDGGWQISKDDYEKAAKDQTEKVIAPARGPILKEIRAFIEANKSKTEQTK
jgi:hypothetical protein